MRKYFIISILIAWAISIIITFWIGTGIAQISIAFEPVAYSDRITPIGNNSDLFLKKYVWGLLGNHSKIFLTTDAVRERPDEIEDLVLEKSETVFYQVKSDTLILFTSSKIDNLNKLNTDFTIVNKVLSNQEFMNKYTEFHHSLKCSDWM